MSLWERIFAAGYDRVMAAPERATLRGHRARLLSQVSGRVLEIGGGTGVNLEFYVPAVEELMVIEPSAPMRRRLERRLGRSPLNARALDGDAQRLPFAEGEFDCAVCTLVLCTVPDPGRALAEIRRVLKPDGRLMFMEHVRAEEPRLARWQDRLDGLHRRLAGGCHCNRDTLGTIQGSGFRVADVQRDRIRRVRAIVRPLTCGVALPA